MKFKHLIDEKTIDFLYSGNFANIKDIRKKNIRTKFGYKLIERINMARYFENIIVGLHIFYVLHTYAKFCANRMLFTIGSINFFMHSFRLQKIEI